MKKIKNIAFQGVGGHSLAYVGSIQYLQENNMLVDLKSVIGSSSGAIIALFVAMGMRYDEISQFIMNNVDEMPNPLKLIGNLPSTMRRFVTKSGLDSGDDLEKKIGLILRKHTGKARITFKELYVQTGIELIICGTNLSKSETTYFSHKNDPKMYVKTAIRISIAYPMLFSYVKYNGDIYTDGGTFGTLSLKHWDQRGVEVNPQTLGIMVQSSDQDTRKEINNIIDFNKALFDGMLKELSEKQYQYYDASTNQWIVDKRVVQIKLDPMYQNVFDCDLIKENYNEFISIGYDAMVDYFKSGPRRRINKTKTQQSKTKHKPRKLCIIL